MAAVSPETFQSLEYRMVGPFRGGRSTAVTGIEEHPTTYFMGTTGGGIWKTDDDGGTWVNVSDGFFGGSIGAVDVADSDPSVIYVGTGSLDIRGNTSTGRGVWKSQDGARTWTFQGLEEVGQIGEIVVHPNDPDLVYVAALGHPFGPNPERGIFRSRDGGATWAHVLALDDSTGASSLAMNPSNPRELYAGMWRGERKPWTLISGGEAGGVYKSTDSGESWTKLEGGLPSGVVGKVGVTVSGADPERVWAIIEAEPDGGVYRSDDAGETWSRVNSENKLRQRAWYYTHVHADPRDENTVYALNTSLYRSVDGGVTFDPIPVPHGDLHDIWINPSDPQRIVIGNDGGGQASVNGGRTWSTYFNQPTAELYDVIVDNAFPYRLYGAQQDNTTISVPAWMDGNTLYPKEHWLNVGGCETGPVALHPDRPEITYSGCYGGVIDRFDRTTGQYRNVVIYPQLQLGEAGENLVHRFQWVSPIVVSPHDPNVVYHGSQYVNRTMDGGMTWETLSPDLTTDTPEHQVYSGGPINHDITGVEIFNVVFSIAISPHDADEIWAGSDDGRVHVSRDDGATWSDVTPPGMPSFGTVDEIELSSHAEGRAIVAVHAYRLDDFRPYVFVTEDFGASWRLLTDGRNGIPEDTPVRTVREDPVRRGLLFAGTEFGVFVSFDDGGRWQPLQLNLPQTPITGMRVAHDDLILSTQGRSFWILDDILPLREIDGETAGLAVHLFAVRNPVRANMQGAGGLSELAPLPRTAGAILDYFIGREPGGPVSLEIIDEAGRVVRTMSSDSAEASVPGVLRLPTGTGHHRVTWDLTYPGPRFIEGQIVWGYTGGIKAPPGRYEARLLVDDQVRTTTFEMTGDPRLEWVTQADYQEQFELAVQVRDTLDSVLDAIRTSRSVRDQVNGAAGRAEGLEGEEQVKLLADSIATNLTAVEGELIQTSNASQQDPIRHPPRLDNQYVELFNYVTGVDGYISGGPEGRPTAGAYERASDLDALWEPVRLRLQTILDVDVERFNQLIEQLGIPAVALPGRPRVIS
jgi:photosystem II stability/assembly factor-like uncharacterized protein